MSEKRMDPRSEETLRVAGELRVVIGKLRRKMNQGRAFGDFTPSQIAALARLESEGPATVTTLAEAEGVRPQSMGAKVAALAAAGLVSSAPDPTDGRQRIWSLTDSAVETVRASRAAKDDWLVRAISSNFTDGEATQLAAGVALLTRLSNS
ncbi:MAG: MarR family transcriptional regulator [Specibacter sp.]